MKVLQNRLILLPEYENKIILGNPGIGKSYLTKYCTSNILDCDTLFIKCLKDELEKYSDYVYYFPTINGVRNAMQIYSSRRYIGSPPFHNILDVVYNNMYDYLCIYKGTALLATPIEPLLGLVDNIFLQPNIDTLRRNLLSTERKNTKCYGYNNLEDTVSGYKKLISQYPYKELQSNSYLSDVLCYKEEI